ncbi:L-lactate dehydrogenase (cytochrome) [Sphingobium faniae]|nr:L-lactate dehydrogenase (cytochrome) [Sphingobium faniae]
MTLLTCANIADLRAKARAVLPKPIFDLYDGAAFEEKTLAANIADFGHLRFRQRVVRDVSSRNLATTIVGQPAAMPVVISPTGMSGLLHRGVGELDAARAARAAGVPFTLGAMSICPLEQVAAAVGPVWFQLFLLKDKGLMASLVERAVAVASPVLIITVSWPIAGQANRSIRNGTDSIPPRMSPAMLWAFARKPRWTLGSLTGKPPRLGNFDRTVDFARLASMLESTPSWRDIEYLRKLWPGKLVIKGILDPDDARLAFDAGADAISVSNHGGNCLDETVSSISILPRIVEAVADRGEIFMDGGVRSGQDVLKALARGAKACLLGRAHLYGLAAGGEAGVARALTCIRNELDITMGYTGLMDVGDASPAILFDPPTYLV